MILLLMVSPLWCVAQVYKYVSTDFSWRYYDSVSRRWTSWSDWEDCSVLVVLNFNRETITIYSKEVQEYDIVSYEDVKDDNEGGQSLKLICVNEDGLRCHIRIRTLSNGRRQLYVDFNDMMWVYNIDNK